jgi:hypothetical protein
MLVVNEWTHVRRCRLAWHVGPCWKEEHIVDAIDQILRTDVLFPLFLLHNRSVHTNVRDSFRLLLIILQLELAAKREDQVLQEVGGHLSPKQEVARLKQLSLFLRLIIFELQLANLWRVLELELV